MANIGIDLETGKPILITGNGGNGSSTVKVFKGTWTATGQTDFSTIPLPVAVGDLFIVDGTATIGAITYSSGDLIEILKDVAVGGTILQADIKLTDINIATQDNIMTFTNKVINADNNTISNLELDNQKTGVVQTTVRASGVATDSSIVTEKAIRTELDTKGNIVASSIITTTQKVAIKGLSCISNDTPNVLAKADIPLTYAMAKLKYDTTENEQSDVTEVGLTDGMQRRCIYKEDGEYYFSTYQNNVMKSSEASLTSPTLVLTPQILLNEFLFYMGTNANFILGNRVVGDEAKTLIEVYTKANVYVKTLNLNVAIIDLSYYTKFKDIDGMIYLCTANALIRFADSVDITSLDLIYDSTSVKKVFAIEKLANGKFVMPIIKADNTKCVRVVADDSDFSTFTENVPSVNYGNSSNFDMILDGTTLCLAAAEKKYTSTDGETWTETNLPYINGHPFRLCKMGTSFKLIYSTTILTSVNFSGVFDVDKSFTISELDAVYCLYSDDDTLIFGERELLYSATIKKVYTDVWGETSISYYKCLDVECKICLPSQDTALATIFQNYGQAPYFRLDTNNETLTLPRIRNKYSYMQLLDVNYLEAVADMSSGNFERFALASEAKKVIFSQLADKTLTNSDTETSLIDTINAIGNNIISANSLQSGSVIKATLRGKISTASSAPTTTLKIKFADTVLVTNAGALPTNWADVYFETNIVMTVRAIGDTGKIILNGNSFFKDSTTISAGVQRAIKGSEVQIDTTVNSALDCTYTWSAASTDNSITVEQAIIEVYI